MSARVPVPGTVFRSDDGLSIVVEPDTDPVTGLIGLLVHDYGGEWSETNPVLVEAAASLKVEVWRSCTKAWREGEGVDDGYGGEWWAPHGDGARQVHVVWYPRSIWDLGERAEANEPSLTGGLDANPPTAVDANAP